MSLIDTRKRAVMAALEAAIQKPLSPEEALDLLAEIEDWCEATRDALGEDIERSRQ